MRHGSAHDRDADTNDEPKWHARSRNIALTRKDLEDFTEIVRARYPNLFIYETGYEPKVRELDHFGQTKRHCDVSPYRPDPPPYVKEFMRYGRWTWSNHNLPKIFVEIYQEDIQTRDLRAIEPNPHTRPIDAVVRRFGTDDFIRGAWQEGNEERRKFVQSFFYMAGKFMTNDFDAYDIETGKHLATYRKCVFWSGPDAIRLAETDRDFYSTVYYDSDFNTWVGYKAIPRIRKK